VQEDVAARVSVNRQKLAADLKTRVDYIVCGADASGRVVAARLAADPTPFTLIEALPDPAS